MTTSALDTATASADSAQTRFTVKNTNATIIYSRLPHFSAFDWLNIANCAKQRFVEHVFNDRWEGEHDTLRMAVKKAAAEFH